MENKGRRTAKDKRIFIRSDEGKIVGEHWIAENGETGMRVKNKGFVPSKRLLELMTS